jgi:hypothetical protein
MVIKEYPAVIELNGSSRFPRRLPSCLTLSQLYPVSALTRFVVKMRFGSPSVYDRTDVPISTLYAFLTSPGHFVRRRKITYE